MTRRPLIPQRPRRTLTDPVTIGAILAGTDPDGTPPHPGPGRQLPIDPEATP